MTVHSLCARAATVISMSAAVVVAAASCHSTNNGPTPTSIVFNAGQNQVAAKGTTLPINPSVQILDPQFNGVQSVRVIFAVTSGGGSITGDTAYSDANGIATVGSWTLGPNPGANTLTATSFGLQGSPLTFTATGN
jgi:adhesin/invasin